MVAEADLERDHLFRQNVAPAQATIAEQYGSLVIAIKNALKGLGTNLWRDPISNTLVTPSLGLWTTVASAGGNNGGAFVANTNDNWIIPGDIILANSGNRSWQVLQSPTGFIGGGRYIQLLLACDNAAGTQRLRIVAATNLNPFNVSSPSTTAAPSNPTGASENTDTTDQVLANTTLNAHHWNAERMEDGSIEFSISQDGSGIIQSAFRIRQLADFHAADNYPYCLGQQRTVTGTGAFGLEGQWNGTSNNLMGHFIDGTAIDVQMAILKIQSTTYAGSTADGSGDGISHDFKGIPILCFSNATAARNGFRGRIPDLLLKYPQAIAINTLEPGADPIRRITVGDFVMLTDGATNFNT